MGRPFQVSFNMKNQYTGRITIDPGASANGNVPEGWTAFGSALLPETGEAGMLLQSVAGAFALLKWDNTLVRLDRKTVESELDKVGRKPVRQRSTGTGRRTDQYKGAIVVDPQGDWRALHSSLPVNWTVLGTAQLVDGGIQGVLCQSETTGEYFLLKADNTLVRLDGRVVAAHLGKSGRKATLHGGRDAKVYLDVFSLAIAEQLGDGNVSKGVRRALKVARQALDAGFVPTES
ncbi:hypothetical protein [Burkholderia cepacia]